MIEFQGYELSHFLAINGLVLRLKSVAQESEPPSSMNSRLGMFSVSSILPFGI